MACYDFAVDYMLRWCDKIARDGIKSVTIKPDVLREFNDYSQEFLKKTVWSSECRSWYKNHKTEGRVTAVSNMIGGGPPQATTCETLTTAYAYYRCTPEASYIIGKCCRPSGRRTSILVIGISRIGSDSWAMVSLSWRLKGEIWRSTWRNK